LREYGDYLYSREAGREGDFLCGSIKKIFR
jgi:hypothetical protein